MRRTCQGYCGGYVDLAEAHTVGRDGEKFCEDCYERWRQSRAD
ncbi:hypothetical protein [Haloterrigena gelatinilytica]|nr:hypothetical protein [Haloterrigena gelatinilytica]